MDNNLKKDLKKAKDIIDKNIFTAKKKEEEITLNDVEKLVNKNYLLANQVLNKILLDEDENTHFRIQACKTIIEAKHKQDILQNAFNNSIDKNISFNIVINKGSIKIKK